MGPISFVRNHRKQFQNNRNCHRIYRKIQRTLSFFVLSPIVYKPIPERNRSARVNTLGCHLLQSCPDTDCRLFGLSRCLPEAYVIHELVRMGFNLLLSLVDAPYFNPMLRKPFKNKRRFVFNTTETVEHKNEKHIIFPFECGILEFLYRVTLGCRNLETRDTLFLFFDDDRPPLPFGKLAAGNPLHRNIVFHKIDLLFC